MHFKIILVWEIIMIEINFDWIGNLHQGCRSGGARGVVVIVVGNGHGDTSSKPGRDWLHFT